MAATIDDVRERLFESIESDRTRGLVVHSNYVVMNLVPWLARRATDAEIVRWMAKLERAHEIRGLAYAAIERERAGRTDSARELLRLAETRWDTKQVVKLNRLVVVEGLAPAWWRLGEREKADAEFEALRRDEKWWGPMSGFQESLVNVAALGRRADLVDSLLPSAFRYAHQHASQVAPGLVSALEDGEDGIADAILARMSEAIRSNAWIEPLHAAMWRATIARPRRILDATLRWPRVMSCAAAIPLALRELERRDPAEAVDAAQRVLDEPLPPLEATALAVLTAHDPALAAERTASDEAREREPDVARLAALGRAGECRAALGDASAAQLSDAMRHATDPELARDLARAAMSRGELLEQQAAVLADLGDDDWLDAELRSRAATMRERSSGEPSADVAYALRWLLAAAAQSGRVPLARELLDAAWPDEVVATTRAFVAATAEVGDFDAALTALERLPEDALRTRLDSTIRDAFHVPLRAPYQGVRAIPLRARSASYVRRCIARGDRAVVEWMLVASKGAFPPALQVEIDRFLERG